MSTTTDLERLRQALADHTTGCTAELKDAAFKNGYTWHPQNPPAPEAAALLGYRSRDAEVAEKDVGIAALKQDKAQRLAKCWMPIATAPKDGSRILVVAEYGIEVAEWSPGVPEWGIPSSWVGMGLTNDEESRDLSPTHWQPLPPLPIP